MRLTLTRTQPSAAHATYSATQLARPSSASSCTAPTPTYSLPTHGATCVRFTYARTPPTPLQVRLTYSVELSPRLWVPVALLEGRIAEALGDNLVAIRDHVVGGGAAAVPEG